jgi:hypothetical protein
MVDLKQRLAYSEDQRVKLLTMNEELRHEIKKLERHVSLLKKVTAIKHGLVAYQRHHCRCAVCYDANSKYQAEYRKKLAE